MEQNLSEAAQLGDIDSLYALLRHDPNVLERIDKIPFTDTPLHMAASTGCTHFALEMIRLKPSFGRKLNPDGFSPLDLALRNGRTETARRLANYEPELIRVQGRESITPLHYVAETGDADLLAEFLLTCPASIKDLTIRGETVVHIAVESENFRAFKVLLGWLQRADKVDVLNWRNEEGNTVLHIAAYKNQTEVIKLLMKKVVVNDKNSEGLTALDILMSHPEEENLVVAKKLLVKAGASKASSLSKMCTLADFLSTKGSVKEKLVALDAYRSMGLSGDMRNAVLVVAVLIATATFQAVLQPPGGVSQGDNNPLSLNNSYVNSTTTMSTITNTTTNSTSGIDSGKAVMKKHYFYQFIFWNSVTFGASLGIIYILLPPEGYFLLLYISIIFLMQNYINAASVIAPSDDTIGVIFIQLGNAVFCLLIYLARPHRMPRKVTAVRRMTGNNSYHDRREMEKLFSLCKYYKSRNNS